MSRPFTFLSRDGLNRIVSVENTIHRPFWTAAGQIDGVRVESTLENLDDAALVELCLHGRRDAFDVIVGRHRRAVYQLCYRFVMNHEDASDLSQEVFIRAFRGLRGFKGQSALGTWLYRIGVNVCLNRVSVKTPHFEPLEAVERVDARAEAADVMLERHQVSAHVRAAIARLPRKQRATLILRTYHELPHEEVEELILRG